MNKRYLALFIGFVLIFQLFPVFDSNTMTIAQSTSTPYYDGNHFFVKDPYYSMTWADYKLNMGVPIMTARTILVGGSTFYFNMEIWEDLHIIVYGSHDSITNEFKNATNPTPMDEDYTEIKGKGYYEGGTGEYRYHGFDAVGNKYSNNHFPRDAVSKSKASEKQWIYQIWKKGTPFYSENRIKEASDYNKIATGELFFDSQIQTQMQKSINDSLPFELVSTYQNTNKDAYNYAHVQSMSTTLFSGEALMYHYRSDLANPIWYQTFSLEPTKQKLPTPVLAEIEVVDREEFLIGESASVEFTLKVTGTLQDEHMWDKKNSLGIADNEESDKILRATYYHREDIDNWTFSVRDQITNTTQTVTGQKISPNSGEAYVTITIPYESYSTMVTPDDTDLEVNFYGVATSNFNTGEKASGNAQTNSNGVPVPVFYKPLIIDITAPHEMLDTEKFKIVDNTPMEEIYIKTVSIEGTELSPEDAETFTSGQYLFPMVGEDLIYTYSIKYYDTVKKIEFEYINYILVYTTKPKAQFKVTGTLKENRLIEAQTDVSNVNSAYLRANATINTNSFSARNTSGDDSLIKYGTQNLSNLAFIVKGTEEINIQMQVTANVNPSKIERSDIPVGYHTSELFNYRLYTQADYAPAMIANIWNSTLARNEKLDITYDASSVDHDTISINTYKIYYDADGDFEPETLVKQDSYANYTEYKPTSLGHYKIVFYAEETFGQPTLAQFITTLDKRTATIERDIFVDNLSPMTKLYTDIEYDFPEVDVMVLNDQDITRELNNSIVTERMNWINGLRQSGMNASVQVWDLYTYVYSQSASTTLNTGSSTPPATTPYSSGGYTGTLSKYNTVNNQYQVDNGSYKTVKDTISISDTLDNSGTADYVRNATGWYVSSTYAQNGLVQLPSSISYNSGGYTGTMSKVGGGTSSDSGAPSGGKAGDTYTRYTTWYANYSGTASKSVQVWQSNWVWINDYTGYYAGTIYKNVKQSFTPSLRMNSDKYLVYFADAYINNLVDIQSILSKSTCKIILVGNAAIKSQLAHDYFIDGSQPIADIMVDINALIADANPYENKQTVLQGETFIMTKSDHDDEGDPITDLGYAYVHDASFYDNSTGQETGTVATLYDATFTTAVKSSFSKPGHYSIYRKVKDAPIGKASFGKESNVPKLDIYVHRKPIADFTLDWDYDSLAGKYKTTWVDKSYDLDHQYSDAQKGIRDRKIRYRKTSGDNVWIYSIPENLTSGTYEVKYTVKDIEDVWSDEVTKLFTLSAEPPIQLDATLRALEDRYYVNEIPASEILEIFDLQTRYHRAHQISLKLINQSGQTLREAALLLSNELPLSCINGNRYNFENQLFQVMENLVDGAYFIRITANSSQAPVVSTTLDLPFHVVTPISIEGTLGAMTIGEIVDIEAMTTKYAKTASVVLFEGTPHAITVALEKTALDGSEPIDMIKWRGQYRIPALVPEGNYSHLFTARTASGKTAQDRVDSKLEAFAIQSVDLKGYWNHWRGQIDVFGARMDFTPHRFLSYEKVQVTAEITGNPDSVTIRFSPELEAMQYTNSIGQTYTYREEMGYEVAFPFAMALLSTDPVNGVSLWQAEYVLPLCKGTLTWEGERVKAPYKMIVIATKGESQKTYEIDDIEMTGNIYDMIYVQPNYE